MTITRQVDLKVYPTVTEVAQAFCDMCAEEQAQFFNEVAYLSNAWAHHLAYQLQYVCDSPTLTPDGRSAMQLIGEYAFKK